MLRNAMNAGICCTRWGDCVAAGKMPDPGIFGHDVGPWDGRESAAA